MLNARFKPWWAPFRGWGMSTTRHIKYVVRLWTNLPNWICQFWHWWAILSFTRTIRNLWETGAWWSIVGHSFSGHQRHSWIQSLSDSSSPTNHLQWGFNYAVCICQEYAHAANEIHTRTHAHTDVYSMHSTLYELVLKSQYMRHDNERIVWLSLFVWVFGICNLPSGWSRSSDNNNNNSSCMSLRQWFYIPKYTTTTQNTSLVPQQVSQVN